MGSPILRQPRVPLLHRVGVNESETAGEKGGEGVVVVHFENIELGAEVTNVVEEEDTHC